MLLKGTDGVVSIVQSDAQEFVRVVRIGAILFSFDEMAGNSVILFPEDPKFPCGYLQSVFVKWGF